MSFTPKRIDANQGEVVSALRRAEFNVVITSGVHKGFPDIVVSTFALGFGPYCVLMEIKDGRKPESARKLTDDQMKFARRYLGPLVVVYSPAEAVWVMQQIRNGDLLATAAWPFLDRLPPDRPGRLGNRTVKRCPSGVAPDVRLDAHWQIPRVES